MNMTLLAKREKLFQSHVRTKHGQIIRAMLTQQLLDVRVIVMGTFNRTN